MNWSRSLRIKSVKNRIARYTSFQEAQHSSLGVYNKLSRPGHLPFLNGDHLEPTICIPNAHPPFLNGDSPFAFQKLIRVLEEVRIHSWLWIDLTNELKNWFIRNGERAFYYWELFPIFLKVLMDSLGTEWDMRRTSCCEAPQEMSISQSGPLPPNNGHKKFETHRTKTHFFQLSSFWTSSVVFLQRRPLQWAQSGN